MGNKHEFKTLSIDGCEILGQGAHGTVYKIAEDSVVKVYRPDIQLEKVQMEKERAKRALILGVPTAISFDIVKVGECYGAVYELLDSEPLDKFVNKSRANLDYFIESSVTLLKEIHSIDVTADDLPDMKEDHLKWNDSIRELIGEDKYQKIKAIINKIPDSRKLLHGDFHMKNIIYSGGELMLIDMDTLCYGDEIFDLATITNSYLIFPHINEAAAVQHLGISVKDAEYIWDRTLSLYLKDKSKEDIDKEKIRCQILGIVRILDYVNRGGIPDGAMSEIVRTKCLEFLEELI